MFAAIFTRAGRADPKAFATGEALLSALYPYTQPDVSGVWTNETALIAQGVVHNTPESVHERAPEICADTGRVIASWVRLDNRAELCAQLRLEERRELTDPQIILAAHRAWGRDCAKRLDGDFSFVIYDPARHEVFCARDAIGVKPLFYMLTDDAFITATSVAAIKAMRGLALSPSMGWIVLGVAQLFYDPVQSAYDNVFKLPPAHELSITAQWTAEPRKYFRFDTDAPHADRRDPRWVDLYRDAFDRAVATRTRSAFLLGSESSAGLDSSSIVSTLATLMPQVKDDLHCFGALSYENEIDLIHATTDMHEIRHMHVVDRPRLLEHGGAAQRALKAIGHPPEHGQILHISSSFCEIAAKFGIRTLFSGYGGDEVVTSHAHHVAAEMFARKSYSASLTELPGSFPRRLARLAKMGVNGPPDPNAPVRDIFAQHLDYCCLKREVIEDFALDRKISEQWAPDVRACTVSEIAAEGPVFSRSRPGRLESEAIFTATYGMEYRYPMLDRGLLAQFFATPAIEKRRQGMGRYLHRRAMAERVPEKIVWQKTKWMGQYIGGSMNAAPPSEIDFEELPDPLRTILDRQKFQGLLEVVASSTSNATMPAIRSQLQLWQVRQFAFWLQS